MPEVALTQSHRRFVDVVRSVTEKEGALLEDTRPMVISEVLSRGCHTCVLAHRGRGKSAMLGMLARQFHEKHPNKAVVLTSPHRASVAIALEWARLESDFLEWTSVEDVLGMRFRAIEDTLLLIDEAAAFPVTTLRALLAKFPHVCAVSTLHGYEGSSMGFKHRALPLFHNVHTLHKPFRAPEDKLEALIHSALYLDAELRDPQPEISESSSGNEIAKSEAVIPHTSDRVVRRLEERDSLNAVFALLNKAHYKTKPADFELLDKPNVHCWVCEEGSLIAACLVSVEHAPVNDSIWLNDARIDMESFLPHTLAQHAGYDLPSPTLRIVRIVVDPEWQRRGVASEFLHHIEKHYDVRSIGAVFGATPELLSFWRKLDYHPVWCASSEDASSGTFAVTMIKNAPFGMAFAFHIRLAS